MPRERILTLNDLFEFCTAHNIQTFSAKEYGKPIVCRMDTFAVLKNEEQTSEDQAQPGLLYKTVKVCHTLENRNKSFISEEAMTTAMPTLKDRPVLAYIHQLEDGTWDFFAHNMEIVEGDDGEAYVEYQERQVGSFTSDQPYLFYDSEQDKTYVIARIAIPTDYTKAAQIIEDKGGQCKVSCELIVNQMHYNREEKYLQIDDFYFNGLTLLGCDEDGNPIEEGMEGAQLVNDATEFTSNHNFTKGGDNQMFESLLQKYGITAEQVEFEYAEMTDEELEAKFAEVFGGESEQEGAESEQEASAEEDNEAEAEEASGAESAGEPDGGQSAEGDEPDAGAESEPAGEPETSDPETYAVNISFELSYNDIISQIYRALYQLDRANSWETCYDVREVFDDYFVYMDYNNPAKVMMAQRYTHNDTEVVLDGEPYQVFAEYLTEDERNELATMRASYTELKEFKDNADAEALEAACQEVLNDEAYAAIAEEEDFVALAENHADFSAEEVRNRADLILAAYVRRAGTYSMNRTEDEPTMTVKKSFNVNKSSTEKDNPYPGLFEDDEE